MDRRLELQNILERILGSSEVYFQPPPSVQMRYPAIVYARNANDVRFADDHPYTITRRYTITVIDRNPDSIIPDAIAELPKCMMERTYTADNLNHFVFTIYH